MLLIRRKDALLCFGAEFGCCHRHSGFVVDVACEDPTALISGNAMTLTISFRSVRGRRTNFRLPFPDQGPGSTVGSTTGATGNVTETMTSPITTTKAHTAKTISSEIRRSRIAMRRYQTVGENRVMFVSNSISSNRDHVEQ